MLKLKQYNKSIDGQDIIDGILKNHGVENINMYKHIESFDINETDWHDYGNMMLVAKNIKHWLSQPASMGVVVDDDADGYTSSAMLIRYLSQKIKEENLPSKLVPIISSRKEHGFSKVFEYSENNKIPDYLIVADAGANDISYINKLIGLGKEIVIIDHHDVEDEARKFFKIGNSKCVMTNCMFESSGNKNLTGVGMVYKVLQTLNEISTQQYDISKSLFAIGEIGDSADVSDLEIRKTMIEGLTNIDSQFLKVFFPGEYDNPLSPNSLSFSIIPRINSVARIGNIDDREMLLRALSENVSENKIVVKKRRKSKVDGKFHQVNLEWSYYEYSKDCFDKLKAKQDKFVKDEVKKIQYECEGNFNLGIVTDSDEKLGSVIGLIANKIMCKTQKPTILVHEFKNGVFNGSLRAPGTLPFKTILADSGLFNFVMGHEQAAGVCFNKSAMESIINKFKDFDFGIDSQDIIVDKIYDNSVSGLENNIEKLCNNEYLFGGSISNPELGFKGITVNKNKISTRGKTASFYWNNIKFMMFNGNPIKELITKGFVEKFDFDIAGSIMEDWSGSPMIAIDFFSGQKSKNSTIINKKPEKNKSISEGILIENGKFIF